MRFEVGAERGAEPFARDAGVEQGLCRAEGFGDDDDERGRGFAQREHVIQLSRVDVRHKVHARQSAWRAERCDCKARAEVRAADADVDHVGDRFAAGTARLAAAQGQCDGLHQRQSGARFRQGARRAAAAQGGVQHGAVLACIDGVAGEHARAPAFDITRSRQIEQQCDGLVGDAVLRIVQMQRAGIESESGAARGVGGEQITQMHGAHGLLMRGQCVPGGGLVWAHGRRLMGSG